jgi:hypothetical protein
MTDDGTIVRDADVVPRGAVLDVRVARGRLQASRTDDPAR